MRHRIARGLLAVLAVAAPRSMMSQQQVLHRSDTLPNVSMRALEIGGVLLAVAFVVDKRTEHVFQGYYGPNTQRAANTFDKFGEITGIGVVVGGLGVAAIITRDHRVVQDMVRAGLSAVIATGDATAMKYTFGRERPYSDVDQDGLDFHAFHGSTAGSPSFPSGHASVAFALATSLGDATGKTWAKVGLWGLATGTAWARLQLNQHWVSDVAAGAAVGILSAKFADGRLKIMGIKPPQFVMEPRTLGLAWTVPMPLLR